LAPKKRWSFSMVRSVFLRLVALAALTYVLWGLILFFLQAKLLYRPARNVVLSPADCGLAHEDAAFRSQDGVRLIGWYIPAPDAYFTVLFCHGNGGNITHVLSSAELFHRLGLNCLVFDYRGYGNSEGSPSEAGTYLDARAAFDWLTQVKQIPADRIVVCGRSLGGSIAAHLAAEVEPRALVVESAFTSFPDMAARMFPYMPVRLFARFRYDTLADIKKVRCPVMVMHSKADELVPFDFGLKLFDAANEPRRFVEITGSHNDGFLVSGDRYTGAWAAWLDLLKSTMTGIDSP